MEITKDDLQKLWLYFSSLCLDLKNTTYFVNHKEVEYTNKEGVVKKAHNKWTFSEAFLKILLSASSEFEVVSKLLCNQIDEDFDINNKDITIYDISKIILNKYPKIVDTKVESDYNIIYPLKAWRIDEQTKSVIGLKWWSVYNDLKHSRFTMLNKANLENAIGALASLYVIQLYLQMHVVGDVSIASSDGYYFMSDYTWKPFYVGTDQKLPDFENTAP